MTVRTRSSLFKRTEIVIGIQEPRWGRSSLARMRRAARNALRYAGREGELTILLADDETLCALNRRFRGIPRATNVLSFPSGMADGSYLGDIALALGVAEREAQEGGKTLEDHAAHLAVHGVLHLMGYDHKRLREARVMEAAEIDILKELGIDNPYGHTQAAE